MNDSINSAFHADRDDRIGAAILTIVAFIGGSLSVLLIGAVAFTALT